MLRLKPHADFRAERHDVHVFPAVLTLRRLQIIVEKVTGLEMLMYLIIDADTCAASPATAMTEMDIADGLGRIHDPSTDELAANTPATGERKGEIRTGHQLIEVYGIVSGFCVVDDIS